MSEALLSAFARAKRQERPAFIPYVPAGYPKPELTVDILLALEAAGADIIELGVPFTDPIADGPTIQAANQLSLDQGINSYGHCLEYVKEARAAGLTVPVVCMGYYNPIVSYGEKSLVADCAAAGINGFIVVDLPPEESIKFRGLCRESGLSFVPLLTPTTTEKRLKHLVACADSWLYCVSLNGVTGERATISSDLPAFIDRVRAACDLPIAIGFGVSTREQFVTMSKLGDGVVIGSAVCKALVSDDSTEPKVLAARFVAQVTGRTVEDVKSEISTAVDQWSCKATAELDIEANGEEFTFGDFGGRYVPETLVDALDELDRVWKELKDDPEFWAEFKSYYQYIGRPSSCHLAPRLTEYAKGARIWLKREDLNHTGAHKINNAIGQALIAKRIGKPRIIAETGAGQHGVATATACALLGLDLTVYMGAEDVKRQSLNVFRMELLGAKVVAVESGSRTLKDAINEAMRDWVTNIDTTHYLIGSAIGPYPFPQIVREFQSVIGREAKEQMMEAQGKLPDYVVACVGGGSNAIGLFHPFVDDKSVKIVGVEAAGDGIDTGRHSATLTAGVPGVLHGTRTFLLQDNKGQIEETHSISAGLDYPGVGPEHAFLKVMGRAEYVAVDDRQSLEAFMIMSQLEGIIPALETSHAVYHTIKLAASLPKDQDVLLCVSGRGDKDVMQIREALPKFGMSLNEFPDIL
eukprot:CFRG7737T1